MLDFKKKRCYNGTTYFFNAKGELMNYLLVSNLFHFVFCIGILIFIRVVLETKSDSTSRSAFKQFVTVVAVCLFADMTSYIFDNNPSLIAKILNHVSMFISVLTTAFAGYWWNHFLNILFHIKRKSYEEIVYALPMLILCALLIVNVFTGIIYTIDDNGVYHRGELYFLSFILQYVSFAYAMIRAIIMQEDMRTKRREQMRRGVVLFGVLVLLFGFSQAFAGGYIALHCFGLTFGVFNIFVRFQDDQITHDRLTGLNNRYALDTYMVSRMQYYERGNQGNDRLYLLMMDINNFKSINDKYGHPEGDRVLCEVADALREISELDNTKLFMARYGGDEFAAVLEAKGDIPVKKIIIKIKESIAAKSEALELSFSMGVGYAEYVGREMDMSTWIAEADRALYVDKNGGEGGGDPISYR